MKDEMDMNDFRIYRVTVQMEIEARDEEDALNAFVQDALTLLIDDKLEATVEVVE